MGHVLVNCAAYRQGKKLADIPMAEIGKYSSVPDCFVWVALMDPDGAEMAALQQEFGLHELAIEDARVGHQRPKLEEYGSTLFVVVQPVEVEGAELHAGQIAIFIGPNFVITVRRGLKRGFSELRNRSEQEPDLLAHGPAYVLYALLDTVVDWYFPVLDALSDETEALEEKIFAGQTTRAQIEALYGLKRKLMQLKHAVSPLLEVMGKLHGGRVPSLCAGLQDYFRDVHDHLARLDQLIDSLRDMVTTAISVNVSLITLQETDVTKRLASYAALIAVPTFIVGIYGMNFAHMPELQWQYGYPMSLAVMAAADGYLFYRFRKARWL